MVKARISVVDHFSQAATEKVIRHWQQDILPNLGTDRAALGLHLVVRRLPVGRDVWLHKPTDTKITQRRKAKAKALRITEIDPQKGGSHSSAVGTVDPLISWQVTMQPRQSRAFLLKN